MEPAKGPPLPKHLEIYWPWYKPPAAEFRVSNLIISPLEVNPGQVVTISVKVTNIGTEAGDYTVKLGGDFTGEQSLTLEPTESRTISFEAVPDVAKTYHISVDGLTGTFRATEAPVEIVDFELAMPTVTPATITPGTAITITCPITSACTKAQTITAKVIIYEGSILPGHGSVIATKTSPSFSISPGQSYNVIVHHTAVAGTIDRRDIEVEVYIAGKLVKESEWDDVYYVEKPVIPEHVIELPYFFTVLSIEGIPFSKAGLETIPADAAVWEAFGKALPQGINPYTGNPFYIEEGRGVDIALCMMRKNPTTEDDRPGFPNWGWGVAMYQCGLEHPEYLTDWAKSYPPPDTFYATPERCAELGGAVIGSHPYDPAQILCMRTWTITNWERCGVVGCWSICGRGGPRPYEALVAHLAEPIVMDALRGITVGCLYRHDAQLGAVPTGTAYLRFRPTFPTEMGPTAAPAYRGFWSFTDAQDGKQVSIAINQLFGAGYYYKGIYDAEIDLGAGGDGKFIVRNLARVTGEGTV